MPVNAPFYSSVKRFEVIGLHPDLDPTVIKQNNRNVAPNSYRPNFKLSKPLASESPWDRKVRTEQFSKQVCRKRNPHIYDGPGHYDIDTNTFKKSAAPAGSGFSLSQRHDPTKNDVPPPGIYCGDILKNSTVMKKQFTTIPTFEWDGFKERFRMISWTVPPNKYNPKDPGSIEARLKKVVSLKGPYQLFTGPRDGSTIKNHFSVMPSQGAPKFYDLESHLDYLLTHPIKKNCGVFSKLAPRRTYCKRQHPHGAACYVRPESPGPASYDIKWHMIKSVLQSNIPFNSTVRSREVMETIAGPGPGRYFIQRPTCNLHQKRKKYAMNLRLSQKKQRK